jgi:hypothetical protein
MVPNGDDLAVPIASHERRKVPNGDYCEELSDSNSKTTYHSASRRTVVSVFTAHVTHFFTTMLPPLPVVSSPGVPQHEQCPMRSNASKRATHGFLSLSWWIARLP